VENPLLRTALFWDIPQRVVVIRYRSFGTSYRSHLLRSRTQLVLDPWRARKSAVLIYFAAQVTSDSTVITGVIQGLIAAGNFVVSQHPLRCNDYRWSCPVYATEANRGSRGTAPLILNYSSFTPGEEPRYPLNRRLSGSHSRPRRFWSWGNIFPCWYSNTGASIL
jgi:hypothetical protein